MVWYYATAATCPNSIGKYRRTGPSTTLLSPSAFGRLVFQANMKPCVFLVLSAMVCISNTAPGQTYSTRFKVEENPLSDRGKWQNSGLDWTSVRTSHGIAFGTQTGTNTGARRYDDSYAHLSGFPPDQEAWGQAYIAKPDSSCHQELEVLLRWASSPHRTTGYECFARCVNNEASYVQIVRWEGPLGKFTYLADLRGTNYGLKHGDLLKASIVGNLITVYINGVEKARVTDDTHKSGNPGLGLFLQADGSRGIGSNTNFGFASFAARGLGASDTNAAPAGSTPTTPVKKPNADKSKSIAAPAQPAPSVNVPQKASFPRLMGMNIGAKNYDDLEYQKQLARLDVVILGFYKGWKPRYGMEKVVRNLKELSGGNILVGQYTILNECGDDPKNSANLDVQTKLHAMNWWARKTDGSRVQWTAQYRAWDINFTAGSKPDADSQRFPQWLAQRDDDVFFKPVPFDLWYCDNVMGQPRVTADWNGDGTDDNPKNPVVAAACRAGHRAEWDHIRTVHPGLPLMGNTDGDLSQPEFAGQLEGAFLEGLMGKSWSIETRAGWLKMMQHYRGVRANTRAPHLVGFNVHGKTNDYRFFRYAFASCLLDDGYFCFTDEAKGYSSVAWFDEFDFKLGAAISGPPTAAWKNGVWRRDFERGIVLLNPTTQRVTVELEPGFRRLPGNQDSALNDGNPAASVTLRTKDGMILRRP